MRHLPPTANQLRRQRAAAAHGAETKHGRTSAGAPYATGLDGCTRRYECVHADRPGRERQCGSQIYPWSEGALYQVYAAPGQITNIALEPGEALTGAGPIAAGDTARWIIGDTESGSGATRRVHILVKPTRPDITTNLVVTTDRRTYMIELRAEEQPYMPAVAWAYPQPPATQRATPATPSRPAISARHYRYGLQGDSPPWRPVSVFDDGRRVYIDFPAGIVQGEMPPLPSCVSAAATGSRQSGSCESTGGLRHERYR